jgi:hypothetical protein
MVDPSVTLVTCVTHAADQSSQESTIVNGWHPLGDALEPPGDGLERPVMRRNRPAIEIAATQTKSAYADSRHLQPAQAGFGAVAAISIA